MKVKRAPKPVHYFTGDIECNNPKNREELRKWEKIGYKNFSLGGIVSHTYNSKVEIFVNQHDMWQSMVNKADKKICSKVVVFFHNLKFDGVFFFNEICKSGAIPVFITGKRRLKENEWGIFYQAGRGSRILWIKVRLKGKAPIWLRCSYQLLPYSVKELGEMVGIPKLEDFDYDKIRNYNNVSEIPKREIMYLENDILIVKRALQNSELRMLFGNRIINSTVSSAVFKDMRKHSANKMKELGLKIDKDPVTNYQWNDDLIDFDLGRRGYKGGITVGNMNRIGKMFLNVWYTDRISAYPSVMVGRLPSFRNSEHCYGKGCVHFYKVEVPIGKLKEGMPCGIAHKSIVFDRNNSILRNNPELYPINIFEEERQIIVIWEEELNEFKKWYNFKGEFNYLKTYHFRFDNEENYIIKDFILEEYKKKVMVKQMLASDPDNETLQNRYKVTKGRLNSTYGHMGMNDTVERKYLDVVGKSRITACSRLQHDGKYVWRNEAVSEDIMRKDIFKASYITMKQRVALIKMIEVNKDIFIYADTDSIFTTKKPKLSEGAIFGEELGDWEIPYKWDFIKVSQPKHYIGCLKNVIIIRAGGTNVKEINKKYNKMFKKHNTKCILENYNVQNIRSFKKLVHVWYEWGSALMKLETQDKWIWNCAC